MKFILTVLFLPVMGALLYTALYPRESALFGRRWQFKNADLEPSDAFIKYSRSMSIILLIIISIVLLVILFSKNKTYVDLMFSFL